MSTLIYTPELLFNAHPTLSACRDDIAQAQELMLRTARSGGTMLICGNGGSCADADHMVGELMKGFLLHRPMNEETQQIFDNALGAEAALPFKQKLQGGIRAISLCAQSAVLSAYANDVDAAYVYAQMVYGYAKPGDLFIGFSTSGNSANVVNAAKAAKALGISTLALTGEKESRLSAICDCTVRVPECETYRVQELHLPVYHHLCATVEQAMFGEGKA